MKKLCALISLLSLLVVAVSCDDDATNTTECETGETRNGTVMCGLNNEGVLLQSCQDGAFVDTTICTGTDICTNDATQVGETPCNETGFYIQLCGQGAWADTTDCTVTITGCTPDATQVGTTVCGLNDEGFIVQVCSGTGVWQDSWECTGTDECINGARQEGTTPCNDTGVIYQDCSAGTWVDSADCTVGGCVADATQLGTTVCGLNDEGFIVQLCSALGVWEDTWECSGTDVCVNGAQQEGTTVCHTTGVLYQDCTGGQWVDSANCTVGGCMEDATQVGTTVCGLNDEGFFIELCDNAGAWNDTAQCTGTDICINGAADSTTCAGGLGTQDLLCSGGTWVNDGLCQCASGYHYTGTTCAQDITVTWCDIVSPMDYDGLAGTPETIYAQIYGTIGGSQVTNSGAELESIDARVCYDDGGVEVCTDATYNPSCLSCGNNDEYMAPLTFDASGTYGYYYKFSGDMGATWTTCSTTFTASITGSGSGGAEPPNGDFEDWTAGSPDSWTDMDTGITVAQETTTVHAGSSAAAVTVNTSTQADTDFTQTIPVVSGTTYDVSVWIYHPVGTHVRVAISHSSSFGTFSDPAVQGSWQLVTSSFTAAAATALVGVRFYDITGFAAGELVYIDDFSVTPQ